MKIYVATDHGALDSKNKVVIHLKSIGHEVIDLGTNSPDSCHYPEYATKLAREVILNNATGVLLCGSGIGVSIVANKYQGITAALCRSVEDARLAKEHNDANVICFGGRSSKISEIIEMLDVFLKTEFEGGRHKIRTDMFSKLGTEI